MSVARVSQDLAIPLFKDPNHMHASPYLGRPQPKRDLLMSFRGDMGRHRGHDTMCFYSRWGSEGQRLDPRLAPHPTAGAAFPARGC